MVLIVESFFWIALVDTGTKRCISFHFLGEAYRKKVPSLFEQLINLPLGSLEPRTSQPDVGKPSEWYQDTLLCCIPWDNVVCHLLSRAIWPTLLGCIQSSALDVCQHKGRNVPDQTICVASQKYVLK